MTQRTEDHPADWKIERQWKIIVDSETVCVVGSDLDGERPIVKIAESLDWNVNTIEVQRFDEEVAERMIAEARRLKDPVTAEDWRKLGDRERIFSDDEYVDLSMNQYRAAHSLGPQPERNGND